jgi:hypothetical protein
MRRHGLLCLPAEVDVQDLPRRFEEFNKGAVRELDALAVVYRNRVSFELDPPLLRDVDRIWGFIDSDANGESVRPCAHLFRVTSPYARFLLRSQVRGQGDAGSGPVLFLAPGL